MTQDEMIEMARQAGMHYRRIEDEFCEADTDGVPMEMLEAFAKMVAAKEREACAKVCEDNATDLSEGDWDSACINCADHICARGEA